FLLWSRIGHQGMIHLGHAKGLPVSSATHSKGLHAAIVGDLGCMPCGKRWAGILQVFKQRQSTLRPVAQVFYPHLIMHWTANGAVSGGKSFCRETAPMESRQAHRQEDQR